jgi:hypothetical protein
MGTSVVDAMERITNREYNLRLAWEQEQMNVPSRTDYYLMQLAQYLARLPGGTRVTDISKFRILFQFGKNKEPERDKELRAEQSRAAWSNALGGRQKRR